MLVKSLQELHKKVDKVKQEVDLQAFKHKGEMEADATDLDLKITIMLVMIKDSFCNDGSKEGDMKCFYLLLCYRLFSEIEGNLYHDNLNYERSRPW